MTLIPEALFSAFDIRPIKKKSNNNNHSNRLLGYYNHKHKHCSIMSLSNLSYEQIKLRLGCMSTRQKDFDNKNIAEIKWDSQR